uniref:Reverse transcriptase domain-containing protein n=1 Tax=Nothobranchius furzeri TaxID=105023 RepID=A0A8C6LDB2_NOTFU
MCISSLYLCVSLLANSSILVSESLPGVNDVLLSASIIIRVKHQVAVTTIELSIAGWVHRCFVSSFHTPDLWIPTTVTRLIEEKQHDYCQVTAKNTGAPQGCALSPLLYSLYTYDCTATRNSDIIVKFADDTTVVGLITNDDEAAYREENSALTHWCQDNHLILNVAKTKELIVDFRRCRGVYTPITIKGDAVEIVSSFRFLGVHLAEDLTWSVHTENTVKKAHGMSRRILRTFYRCAIESILTGCITTWYGNSTAYNRKALQRVVRCAERIIGGELPSFQDIYRKRCLRKAGRIIKDSTHPSHKLFRLLPSGRRFCSIRSRTSRLRDSFFHQAIRLLNTT